MSAATVNPYGALTMGRVDQGVDFGGAGAVRAVDEGIVRSVGLWHGWPGTGGVVYSTARGNVFVMEDFAPSVKVGQRIGAGDIIGRATGGSSGIETGWANAAGDRPLTPYNGKPDGTPMPGGLSFKAFLQGGQAGTSSAGGSGPGSGVINAAGGVVGAVTDPAGTARAAVKDVLSGWWTILTGSVGKWLLYGVLIFGGAALVVYGLVQAAGAGRTPTPEATA